MTYTLHTIKFNEDDRAQRLIDVFPDIDGQINISYVNSTDHIVAWHRHFIQIDYWLCIKGSFKVGLSDERNVRWEYISDKNFKVLRIEPPIWHGYKALEPNSILLYYVTRKYSKEDEEKVLPGSFNENWSTISK